MTRTKKVTAEDLGDLAQKVITLVKTTTARQDKLEASVKAVLGSQATAIDSLQATVEDLADNVAGLGEATLNITAPAPENITVPAPEDALPLEGPKTTLAEDLSDVRTELTKAWRIEGSGANVYAVGGTSAIGALESLLQAILRDGLSDPAIIDLHVGYGDSKDEEGLPFDGIATVAF